jgi:hypothetical protein
MIEYSLLSPAGSRYPDTVQGGRSGDMRTRRSIRAGAWLLALGMAAPALASITLYRDPGFRGPAVTVDRANANMGLRFPIGSARVASGEWELCPEPGFRGRCLIVAQNTANLRAAYGWPGPLQSVRPGDVGPPPFGPPGGGGGRGETLRGMASQFWPAPRTGGDGTVGSRVLACPGGSATANCAAENANSFCRRQGWTRGAYNRIETEAGRNYLADVLCVRSM